MCNKMDSDVKSACFDEISHLVLDADKQVTVKTISNNWDISLNFASIVLEEWVAKNEKHEISKHYLIKGMDVNENGIVTVVHESKLESLKKKLKIVSNTLYSIETPSKSSKKLITSEYNEIKIMSLTINLEERGLEIVEDIPVEIRKPNVDKQNEIHVNKVMNMFASASSTVKKSDVSEKETIDVKPEKKSDLEESPKTPKKDITIKKNSPVKKDVKKVTPKNSIASFFIQPSKKGNTAVTSSQSKFETTPQPKTPQALKDSVKPEIKSPEIIPNTPKQEKSKSNGTKFVSKNSTEPKKEKKETPKSVGKKINNETATDRVKRTLSQINGSDSDTEDEVIPATPQPIVKQKGRTIKKRTKANNENPKKRSRIMQLDSSDDEMDEEKNLSDVDKTPEKKIETKQVSGTPNRTVNGKKHKAKKLVSKTYDLNDGYITTTKEIEEYSCSEEEVEEVVKTPTKNNNKIKTKDSEKEKKSNEKQKKSTPQKKPATKQGSIMSFFTKK